MAVVLLAALALAGGAGAARAAGDDARDGVTVGIALRDLDTLEVTYRVPARCTELPLVTALDRNLARHLRASWKAEDGCRSLIGNTIHAHGACRDVSFRVPASDEIHDRVYPPAYPIDTLGIYVHTALFAPTEACGPVTWRFAAPGGEVVFDGKLRGPVYIADGKNPGNASHASVYLSARPLPATDGPVTVYAPGVPPSIHDTIEAASRAVDARYRDIADGIEVDVPSVVVSNREDGGAKRVKADVANRTMMRIGFKNHADVREDDAMRNYLRRLVAHEFAHVLQNPAMGDERHSWIAEGGADFLAWITLYRLGWKTAEESASDLADAFNRCIELARDRRWRAIPERGVGAIPYACGFAIHVVALAARADPGSPEAALMRYYRAARGDDAASPARWLDCGGDPACEPRTIPALLEGDEPFGALLVEKATVLGIASIDTRPPGPAERARMAGQAFRSIMGQDCNGSYSFNTGEAYIDVLKSEGCKTLDHAFRIVGFAGVRFDDKDGDAAAAARAACARTHTVDLLKADGATLPIACGSPLPDPAVRLRFDAKALFAKLVRG